MKRFLILFKGLHYNILWVTLLFFFNVGYNKPSQVKFKFKVTWERFAGKEAA